MTEIKFRYWSPTFGRYVVNANRRPLFKSEDFVVEQYTGIKDKDGVEIWEGDLVKEPNRGENMKVYWQKQHARFAYGPGYLFSPTTILEIVGNIHVLT